MINSIVLPLGLICASLVGIISLSTAPVRAQVNAENTLSTSRLAKYSALDAPFLRLGSRGQTVKDVQVVLQSLGFYNGAIDGIYGPKTARAVVAFQRSQRLVGDGRVGVLTWQALLDSNNVQPAPGPF